MVDQVPAPGPEAIEEEIAREVSRIHEATYGTSVENVEVAIHPRFVAIVTDFVLTRAEETLLESGNADSVTDTREAFQQVVAASFIAIVEHATGHRVSSVGSRTVVRAPQPWSLEVFRFDGIWDGL
jgi:uncharacterized protein YbcI